MTPNQEREHDEEMVIDAMRNMVAGAVGLPAMSITWNGDMASGFRRLRFTNLATGGWTPVDLTCFIASPPLDAFADALRHIFTPQEMASAMANPAPPAWTWPPKANG